MENILDEIILNYKYLIILVVLFFVIKQLMAFISKITTDTKCPNCKAADSERIAKGLFTKILFYGRNVKKYQCHKCWKTFFVKQQNTN